MLQFSVVAYPNGRNAQFLPHADNVVTIVKGSNRNVGLPDQASNLGLDFIIRPIVLGWAKKEGVELEIGRASCRERVF